MHTHSEKLQVEKKNEYKQFKPQEAKQQDINYTRVHAYTSMHVHAHTHTHTHTRTSVISQLKSFKNKLV